MQHLHQTIARKEGRKEVFRYGARPGVGRLPRRGCRASRPLRRRGNQHLIAEHQRRYVETLPDGRFEVADSSHFIQAEQPGIVADRVRHLLDQAGRPGAPGPLKGLAPPAQSAGQPGG